MNDIPPMITTLFTLPGEKHITPDFMHSLGFAPCSLCRDVPSFRALATETSLVFNGELTCRCKTITRPALTDRTDPEELLSGLLNEWSTTGVAV